MQNLLNELSRMSENQNSSINGGTINIWFIHSIKLNRDTP